MIELFMIHMASVETYKGAGPTGPTYAAAVDVPCFLQDTLVLTPETGGKQWVNKTTLFTYIDRADTFKVSSRLTVNDRSMIVTGVRRNDGGELLADVTHLEVDVT